MGPLARILRTIATASLMLAAPAVGAQTDAEDEEEFSDELIHSDVPLYGGEDGLVPEHFTDGDSFGCMSRVALGDWSLKRSDTPEDDDPEWLRLLNYGVFHCAIVESKAYSRDELGTSGYRYSFFVKVGATNVDGKPIELWVLQSGTRPGSDYLLLARPAANESIKAFDLLQSECPAANRRRGPEMDIWSSDYCAINSQRELLALAKEMAKRRPLAKLTFVGEAEEQDTDEPADPAAEAVGEPAPTAD